ncbi:MAG: C40 family peptidase [Actinomycetota bacterium]|nr:C40 family peptidase [Actinomycetota bacterium]
MRRPSWVSAVPESGFSRHCAMQAHPAIQVRDPGPGGRHRDRHRRQYWRSAAAGLALIVSGVLVAGQASAAPPARSTSMVQQPALAAAAPARLLATATPGVPRLTGVVQAAMWGISQHIPYVYGGGHGSVPSVSGGADCSGYVRWAYSQGFGVDIGSGSSDSMIRTSGQFVRVSNPVPGDVALFGNGGQPPAYHTGIYVGQQNGGAVLAAEVQTGEPARIQKVWSDLIGYYRYRGATAADLPPPGYSGFNMVLAKLRTTVSTALTSSIATPGQHVDLHVAVRSSNGSPLAHANLVVYKHAPSQPYQVATRLTTNAQGNATAPITIAPTSYTYQVRYAGNSLQQPANSASNHLLVRNAVRMLTGGIPGVLHKGTVARLTGRAAPQLVGVAVTLQRYLSGRWSQAGRAIVRSDGSFSMTLNVGTVGGTREYRAYISQVSCRGQAAGTSPVYRVLVN